MHRIVRAFAFLLLATSTVAQSKNAIHHTERFTIPEDESKPDSLTINYNLLLVQQYPVEAWGAAQNSTRGGCYFMDVTKPGSRMPLVEDKPDHVTIRAPRGHEIEWHCNWNTK